MRTKSVCLFLFILLFIAHSNLFAVSCPEFSQDAARRQIHNLSEEIRYHNRLYYQAARPIISDAEYDRMFKRLIKLEGCFPALAAADSPTRNIAGADQEKLTVVHDRPMLSLDSATGSDAVESLLRRIAREKKTSSAIQLLVQPKVDGLPVELIYKRGRLMSAATRGDGQKGEDVTARVRRIKGLPETLIAPFPEHVVVRGEIYADLTLFRRGNQAQGDQSRYATPRHLAAATLRSRAPQAWALESLRLFPFELVNADWIGLRSAKDGLEKLAAWGFPLQQEEVRTVQTFVEIRDLYREYLIRRDELRFAADGIVVKVDDLELQDNLGLGERAPFWAAAWKFPPETALTGVAAIEWRVGRTGKRTPIALLDPVKIGGIQIKRASLHNADELRRLGVVEGARVVVALKGDVIPQIVEVVSRPPGILEVSLPPEALTPAVIDACLSDGDGCREQFLARAVYFASQLEISGLGRGRVEQLLEAGLISDLPSFFELQTNRMAALPGFGSRSAEQISATLRAQNRPGLERLLTAIGIAGVGPATCKHLARRFDNFDALRLAGRVELLAVDGVSEKAAINLRAFFASNGGKRLLERFRKLEMI